MQEDLSSKSLIEHKQEDAYKAGMRQATDELSLENEKLREMIDTLHRQVSDKSKQIAESNLMIGDLEKQV